MEAVGEARESGCNGQAASAHKGNVMVSTNEENPWPKTGPRWRWSASLFVGFLLLLVACAPSPRPTVSPSPSPEGRPSVLPSRPTWTPLPSPTASPVPTVLVAEPTPTWPAPEPTPTLAPLRFPTRQVGAFFFFWHDCPDNACSSDQVYAIPPGWNEPLAGDPDPLDGLYYSARNRYWYVQELRDMQLAGIEIVLPVSWGESRLPWFRTPALQELVGANRLFDPPLRIGLFDDTSSEVYEYRDHADNGSFDYSADPERGLFLDLRDPICGFLFYDRKIRPFFAAIPQEMWATHDGRPVEEGGRPIIIAYTTGDISHLEQAGALWGAVKNAFQRDFRDRLGRPITPWVILEDSWFTDEAIRGDPSINAMADGRYVWGTALHGPEIRTLHGYTVTSVGPGFDDRSYRGAGQGREQPRNVDPEGNQGDAGTFLRWSLDQVPEETNLLLIETWNELWEGTNICRAAYPDIADRPVAEDFFLDVLSQWLRGQGLWLAAEPLPPSWPPQLAVGQSYRLVLPVRNLGTRSWSVAGGERLVLYGELFPEGYPVWPDQPVRPGEVGFFRAAIKAPAQAGPYSLTWQMYGPEGPFGPPASWTVSVGEPAITTALQIDLTALPQVGQPLTLTVGIDPSIPVQEVHLRVRFDPAALWIEQIRPLPGHLVQRWETEVDNPQGMALLTSRASSAEQTSQIARLQFRPLKVGETGVWVEQVELWLEDGVALILEPYWVPLTVSPYP